ncbi:peptidoglycan-binding domain-containing protein [Deinococcus sp. PESE-13]
MSLLLPRSAALGALLLTSAALAAATSQDVERAADAAALAVDGLIAPCPASVRQASASARCVTSDLNLAATRKALSAASKLNLYGAWRTDGQGRVYNWVTLPNGYVNIGIVPDSTNAEASLILLTPSVQKPAPATPAPTTPAPATPAKTETPAASAVPPFKRPLRLTTPRMNGADVKELQLRLMAVSKVDPGKGGDGWFGPVTEANVIVFQLANRLKPTGVVDRATWNTLFSPGAKYFDAQAAQELSKRRR